MLLNIPLINTKHTSHLWLFKWFTEIDAFSFEKKIMPHFLYEWGIINSIIEMWWFQLLFSCTTSPTKTFNRHSHLKIGQPQQQQLITLCFVQLCVILAENKAKYMAAPVACG